jgi:hypothetical protein
MAGAGHLFLKITYYLYKIKNKQDFEQALVLKRLVILANQGPRRPSKTP